MLRLVPSGFRQNRRRENNLPKNLVEQEVNGGLPDQFFLDTSYISQFIRPDITSKIVQPWNSWDHEYLLLLVAQLGITLRSYQAFR